MVLLDAMVAMVLVVHQIPTETVIRHEQEATSMLCIRSIAVNYSCLKYTKTFHS